jgi:thiol-disulfide isomerase/thioredoxin
LSNQHLLFRTGSIVGIIVQLAVNCLCFWLAAVETLRDILFAVTKEDPMKITVRPSTTVELALVALLLAVTCPLFAASPSAEQALKIVPNQEGVDYDRPQPDEVAKCKMSAKKIDGRVGWVVENPEGVILRKFVDTNGDNIVDQWSYYKDGIEVYRDIDSKYTGKADQSRWFHTAGTRWGVDTAGKGKINAWKAISAEETSSEVVAAVANRDAQRFARVLLTPDELQSLGLGKARAESVAAKIAKADADFKKTVATQKTLAPESKWVQFSGTRPGVVPAGTDDSTRDLRVYENVIAIVQTGEKHTQVQIGTLVQVGDTWKAIDAPVVAGEGQPEAASAGFFFHASPTRASTTVGGPSEEQQAAMATLDKLDPSDPKRIEVLQQVADQAKSPEDRTLWYRQLGDTISAAVMSGKCPDGDKRLQTMLEKLQKNEADKNLAAHVKLLMLQCKFFLGQQSTKVDFPKLQTEYHKDLEQYVTDYPTAPDTAEAMLQLGIGREFAGQEEDAKKWYERIVKDFSDSPQAKKSAGAATRLDSVGKAITLSGKSTAGGTVSLASYRGKVVLIQYWATWSGACKTDIPALKQILAKYSPSFTIIGVSLDNNAKDLNTYLAENKLAWPLIFEEGGLDSPPANHLGILTVPTMILVDQQGKVVNRNVQTADLESELKKLIK